MLVCLYFIHKIVKKYRFSIKDIVFNREKEELFIHKQKAYN